MDLCKMVPQIWMFLIVAVMAMSRASPVPTSEPESTTLLTTETVVSTPSPILLHFNGNAHLSSLYTLQPAETTALPEVATEDQLGGDKIAIDPKIPANASAIEEVTASSHLSGDDQEARDKELQTSTTFAETTPLPTTLPDLSANASSHGEEVQDKLALEGANTTTGPVETTAVYDVTTETPATERVLPVNVSEEHTPTEEMVPASSVNVSSTPEIVVVTGYTQRDSRLITDEVVKAASMNDTFETTTSTEQATTISAAQETFDAPLTTIPAHTEELTSMVTEAVSSPTIPPTQENVANESSAIVSSSEVHTSDSPQTATTVGLEVILGTETEDVSESTVIQQVSTESHKVQNSTIDHSPNIAEFNGSKTVLSDSTELPKADGANSTNATPAEANPVDTRPAEENRTETTSVETKAVEENRTETTSVETKPAEEQTTGSKSTEEKVTDATPADALTLVDSPIRQGTPADPKIVDTTPTAEAKIVDTTPAETKPVATAAPETKPNEAKTVEATPETKLVNTTGEVTPVESKTAEATMDEVTSVESKPAEETPAETKPVNTTPAEATMGEVTSVESKPAEAPFPETTPVNTTHAEATMGDVTPVESNRAEASSSEVPVAEETIAEAKEKPAEVPSEDTATWLSPESPRRSSPSSASLESEVEKGGASRSVECSPKTVSVGKADLELIIPLGVVACVVGVSLLLMTFLVLRRRAGKRRETSPSLQLCGCFGRTHRAEITPRRAEVPEVKQRTLACNLASDADCRAGEGEDVPLTASTRTGTRTGTPKGATSPKSEAPPSEAPSEAQVVPRVPPPTRPSTAPANGGPPKPDDSPV